MNDIARKTIAIMGMAENFGKEFSDKLLKTWLILLAPYAPEKVEAGVVRVIETYAYKTMPPFAVLREAIDEASGYGPKSTGLKAAAEWAWLLEAVSRYGSAAEPDGMNPTTAHVVRVMGGWKTICLWETRYFDFKRKEFLELWTQCDGKTEQLALGASGVQQAIEQGKGAFGRTGLRPLASCARQVLHAGREMPQAVSASGLDRR